MSRYFDAGTRVNGKRELVAVLSTWLAESDAATICDVGSFGGRPGLGHDRVAGWYAYTRVALPEEGLI